MTDPRDASSGREGAKPVAPLGEGAVQRLREVVGRAGDDARASEGDFPDLSGTRYEIIEKIAHGGMGAVYLAEDGELRRRVALKVLRTQQLDPAAKQRMLREARIVARLEHPGIVPIHDVGTLGDGRVYYTMKLVRGQRLDELMRNTSELRPFLRILERICEAVAFAHAHGVIHRDLKPENIMVGSFGEALVMDWGVAKLVASDTEPNEASPDDDAGDATVHRSPPSAVLDASSIAVKTVQIESDATHPGTILGTPGYMSPEQASGHVERVDERSDVYALGSILRRFLDGRATQAPKRARAIADRALQNRPQDRYQRVDALADDVSSYLEGEGVSAYRESLVERIGRVAYRYRTAILLILTYLVVRAALLIFWNT